MPNIYPYVSQTNVKKGKIVLPWALDSSSDFVYHPKPITFELSIGVCYHILQREKNV